MNTTPEQNYPKPAKAKSRWPALLISLIIIIGFSLSCWQILKLQRNRLNTTQRLHYLDLALQRQTQDNIHNKLTITKLSQKLNQNEAAWMIPEIKTLIWRANILLTLEHNAPTAITLLKMANTYIQHLHDPALRSLHKILTDDIATLQNLPKVDISSVYMRIQSLSNQLKHLPLADQFAKNKKPVAPKATVVKTTKPLWKRFFVGTWDTIKTFLVIRHHQQPVQPLLSTQQHQITITKLQILCAQAQWALLQRRNKLYHNLLQKIQQSIKKYFSQNTEYSMKILEELAALQKINVDVQPPKLEDAMQMINKIDRAQFRKFTQTLKRAHEK